MKLGDRVRHGDALATVVEWIGHDHRYVGLSYDVPQPTRYADGTPTTTTHKCVHVSMLAPAELTLLDLLDEMGGRQDAPDSEIARVVGSV